MRAEIRIDVCDLEVSVALPPVRPVRVVAHELLPAGSRGRRGRGRGRGSGGSGSGRSGRRRCAGDRGVGGNRAPVAIDVVRPVAATAGGVEEQAGLAVHDVGGAEIAMDVGRTGLVVGIRYHIGRSTGAWIARGTLSWRWGRRLCGRCLCGRWCRCCSGRLCRCCSRRWWRGARTRDLRLEVAA